MKHSSLVILNLFFCLCFCGSAVSVAPAAEAKFSILYSANVNGELEPCG
jgi:hypothetical protein